MADEVTKTLREAVERMTTRDWLVRVSELSQAVESRDRVIAEQRRTMARLYEIIDELSAKVAADESAHETPQTVTTQRATRQRRGRRSDGSGSENP